MKPSRARFFNVGNRDKNEPQITQVLDAAHLRYKLLPPGFGADILIFEPGLYFCEIKNPSVPPSKRKLTDDELSLQALCAATGTDYFVVLKAEEMVDIVNGKVA